MSISRFMFLILLALFSLQSFAADVAGISKIFKQTFWTSHYEERFCGKNIEGLVRKAMDQGLDLNNAYIVQITDTSGFMFGMVAAVSAREGGPFIQPRQQNPSNLPGEKNWYFHVVLKVDDKILDYDFTNDPKVLTMKEWLKEMWIPKEKMNDLAYRQYKMKGYKITTYPAEDYIIRQNQRLGVSAIEKVSYLKDYMPSFFQTN